MRPIREPADHPFGHRHHAGRHGPAPVDGRRGRRRRGGRGRAPRGDLRTAVLLLLAEQPRHGYQLMQAIGDRSGGRWTPSPGAIYPTVNQLEDEGLVTITADSGRKLATLTDAGREHVAAGRDTGADPFAGYDTTATGADLRRPFEQLHDAVRQVARTSTDTQRAAAAKILGDARRSLYLLLADGQDSPNP